MIERSLERLLFASRWVMAPFYVGLALGLLWLLARFVISAMDLVGHGLFESEDHVIVGLLGLVDLSLMANLILMVIFSGYENFVSRMNLPETAARPSWMGHVGFGELKLKLMTSIVAISAIHVLEDFMNAPSLADRDLAWRGGLHLMFVVSGVLLALMDRISKDPTGEGH